MELDELKQAWHKTESPIAENQNIMDIIQHKSEGPVAALKKAFKRQIILMAFIPVMLFVTNLDDIHSVLTSIIFISYVGFCIGVIVFSYLNYRIVSKMEGMDGMVRSNLEQQINILETRLRMNITGLRIALLFFVILTEIVPYYQHYRILDLWHSYHIMIRYTMYALLFLAQYYFSRKVSQRKFGDHLAYLKELVNEMK